ncbi:MAG TPA: SDR family NAD(P)-dependent oxidoreductase [Pseudolysinimonas sp.]
MGTALVTGGTSGIGAEFARQLAARGHDIVLVARDRSRLDAMAAELRANPREPQTKVEILVADLANAKDTDRVAARLGDRQHPIDYFINNAGFRVSSRLASPDVAEHDRALNVMVRAVLVLGGAVAPVMKARASGAIVNVASINGQLTLSGYSAIKAWVRVYSESLSNELRGSEVTVTALMPGWVRTEFHQRAGSTKGEAGRGGIPNFLWLEPERLVRDCLRDVDKGRVISIPTIRYKFLSWLVKHLPDATVRWVSRGISLSRSNDATD